MSKYVVAVNGSYRPEGMTDTAVREFLRGAEEAGARTHTVTLRDRHIEFCTNCRACMQEPGPDRGKCPLRDDMDVILDELDRADLIVLASPVNFYHVTAVFKRFMERLVGYAYWPWGAKTGPVIRKKGVFRKAVVITSSGAPAFIGRLFYRPVFGAFKMTAKTLGAKVVKTLYSGMVPVSAGDKLPDNRQNRAYTLGKKIASAL